MMSAVAYYRTSSAANVGDDKDSLKRQRETVEMWASKNGYTIETEFYDAAVSGMDSISDRPGFADLLDYVEADETATILVENASRFARDLIVQLTGHALLQDLGYTLIPVDAPTHFQDDTPTANMVRQILGAVSEFEKANLVSKLKAARDRKRRETGRCEGRKPLAETNPDTVATARQLYRSRNGKRRSLRQIATLLATEGHVNSKNRPYDAKQVARMVA